MFWDELHGDPPRVSAAKTKEQHRCVSAFTLLIRKHQHRSSQLMASGGAGGWKDSSLMGWPLGIWPCSNDCRGNTNWIWCIFSFSGEASRVEGEPGRNGTWMWSRYTVWNVQIINRVFSMLGKSKEKRKYQHLLYGTILQSCINYICPRMFLFC